MRCRALLLVLTLALPRSALATPPSVGNSTAPACITLVGLAGGVPARSLGQFTVIVRDLANNPVAGAVVTVDLSLCPDLHVCADQMDADMVVDCVHKRMSKLTGPNGSVNMTVLGGSNGPGNAVTMINGGKIFENGTLIKSPTVSAFDLDGSSGLGANDLSTFLTDFASGFVFGRSDFDCNYSIGANDLSLWLAAFGSATMIESCVATCP